jgi:pimeloyl-ACP methyl ester carboxylesterase
VLAGFSMGGLVAQAVAIRRNVALRGVVFMNAVYARSAAERQAVLSRLDLMHTGGAEGVIAAARERWFGADDRRDRAAKIEEMLGWIRDGDFAPKIKAYEVFATGDAETAGKLARVDIPALALTGELDAGSPPHMTERMAAELSRGRALVLDGQRHMMPVLDAGRVNAALRAFLAGL